jgi:hypothetical protein
LRHHGTPIIGGHWVDVDPIGSAADLPLVKVLKFQSQQEPAAIVMRLHKIENDESIVNRLRLLFC